MFDCSNKFCISTRICQWWLWWPATRSEVMLSSSGKKLWISPTVGGRLNIMYFLRPGTRGGIWWHHLLVLLVFVKAMVTQNAPWVAPCGRFSGWFIGYQRQQGFVLGRPGRWYINLIIWWHSTSHYPQVMSSGWCFQTWLLCFMGCHPSHWRTHIFDGSCTTNQ